MVLENSVNLFIYAKMKDRIRRMNSLETGVDPVKMESRIREVDRKRKDYYQYYTGNEWGELSSLSGKWSGRGRRLPEGSAGLSGVGAVEQQS